MFNFTVSYFGILLAGIGAMVVGSLWYSPLLFSKYWAKEAGWTKEDMERAKKSNMNKAYAVQFVCALVSAWVLAVVMRTMYVSTAWGAVCVAALLWLGLQLTGMIGGALWEKKSWGYVAVNAGGSLVTGVVMALILIAL